MKSIIVLAAIIAVSQATLHKQIIIKKIHPLPSYPAHYPATYAAPEPVTLIKTYPSAGDRYFVPRPEPIYVTKQVSYPAPSYPSPAPLYSEPAPAPAYPTEPEYAQPAYPIEPAYPQPAYPAEPAYAPVPQKVIHIVEAPTHAAPLPSYEPAYAPEPAYAHEPAYAPEPAYRIEARPVYRQPTIIVEAAYPEPSYGDEYKKKK